MVPHADHRIIVLGLMWSALAVCGVTAVVYDVGRWLNAW
jgi:hypothetical protein